jgi:hypothetical protein
MIHMLQISSGRWRFTPENDSALTGKLTLEGLVRLLRRGGFDPANDIIMLGSSIDFPEDDGAPKGFRAREIVRVAREILLNRHPAPL